MCRFLGLIYTNPHVMNNQISNSQAWEVNCKSKLLKQVQIHTYCTLHTMLAVWLLSSSAAGFVNSLSGHSLAEWSGNISLQPSSSLAYYLSLEKYQEWRWFTSIGKQLNTQRGCLLLLGLLRWVWVLWCYCLRKRFRVCSLVGTGTGTHASSYPHYYTPPPTRFIS